MGTFNMEVISSTGTERDFYRQIYNYIVGTQESPSKLWPGITGTVSPDDPYPGPTINNQDFLLDSDIGFALRLQSYPSSRSSTYDVSRGFNIGIYLGYVNTSNPGTPLTTRNLTGQSGWNGLIFTTDGWAPRATSSFLREYAFSKYEDDNIFMFWMTPMTATYLDFRGAEVGFIKIKDTNEVLHIGATAYSRNLIEGLNLYNTNGSNACTKSTMFSYEARTGYLDFISHSTFVSGVTKVASTNDIYDCTTVNFGDTLSIENGVNFLAIGSHSMVPLNNS